MNNVEFELDPDSADLTGATDYQSIDELREDLLDVHNHIDWIVGRRPGLLWESKVNEVLIASIEIPILAAARVLVNYKTASYLRDVFGGDFA